jgi:hypothetical protein
MTVPHGLRSGREREQARRALVDRAVAAATGEGYLAVLRSVEDRSEFDLVAELLWTRRVISPGAIAHRHAKQEALARERERRRA